jgi:hypothetical protein
MHTAGDLITSLASMIKTCTCTCKKEIDREEERKNDEKKGGKEKRNVTTTLL